MTKQGNMITLDAGEAEQKFHELLQAVERDGSMVRITRGQQTVAQLVPGSSRLKLPPPDGRLGVKFAPGFDPVAGLDEDEWPAEFR